MKAKKPIYIECYYGPQENSNKDVQAEYEHTTELVGKYQRNHNVIYTHGRLQCEAKPYNSSWEKKKKIIKKNVNESQERKVKQKKKEYSKAIMNNNHTLIESTMNL